MELDALHWSFTNQTFRHKISVINIQIISDPLRSSWTTREGSLLMKNTLHTARPLTKQPTVKLKSRNVIDSRARKKMTRTDFTTTSDGITLHISADGLIAIQLVSEMDPTSTCTFRAIL